ncbi:LacI family DNA-binding transcriptional regulator [Bifidobacterium sp. ESL0800]|uniref:LacI family DNA-binding transcriptional regulator n=1 Tax=Bifidobacterium sp. ESL0800 TaxID=2983236 RepID=UPI0023F69A14|nr:LacI family DNA-binding transcriptional regulator [Bifidobacterium sp. ESL0800]WEV75289.1 LacI family DNA-binding transcriptional regulator [Bifidobacterium sp. ESL0800]
MTGIKDVAKAAGVSVSTVSYVLSGKRSISSKTTDAVLAAIDKLGYVPNASARKLRGEPNRIIAIAPGCREAKRPRISVYFMQMALKAKERGYDVLLLTGENPVNDIRRVTQSGIADGVVLLDVDEYDKRALYAKSFGKPCVAIGYPVDHDDCACVDIDFAQMGRLVARKLHDYGHKRVSFLRSIENLDMPISGYRLLFRRSFLDSAKDFGIEVNEPALTNYKTFNPRQFVDECLLGKNGSTAIVNQSDSIILNKVLDVLHKDKISVPEDISVISCGTFLSSMPVSQGISEMPITPELLCEEALEVLLDAIERNDDIRGMVRLSPPTFVDRGSFGPVSKTGTGVIDA